MQGYSNPSSRNTMRAAGPVGSNQDQGKGQIPGKVSVPVPGTDKVQSAYSGGTSKAPAGFKNGVIPGKI